MSDMSTRIAAMLATLPTGARGPKTSKIRDSLSQGLPVEACWPWLGRCGANGYGIAVLPGTKSRRGTSAHRLIYQLLNGPIPQSWHVDHICHDPAVCAGGVICTHRACVNPAHLIASTARANVLRSNGPSARNAAKTSCGRGHPFTPANTYIDPAGKRACRTCQRAHWRRYDAIRRGAA